MSLNKNMRDIDFNSRWSVEGITDPSFKYENIDLPFDCMLREKRDASSEGGVNSAWFVGGDYHFTKTFPRPEMKEGDVAILEFEGVYRDAEVYLNGDLLAKNDYGYNCFFVDITNALAKDNTLSVVCHNAEQPNSRWYTGTGIYRPVHLHILPKRHIELNSLRVLPLAIEDGSLSIAADLSEDGEVQGTVHDQEGKEVASFKAHSHENRIECITIIPLPHLWSAEDPYLYTLKLRFGDDEQIVRFGFRVLSYGKDGFFINGKRLLLKGACIHHDNGILGAVSYRDVEFRKVRLLKSLGYNAIRSAHNPIGKYLLEACDELGMYVMDEYVDCWYIHKTKHDYVSKLMENWKEDIALMVAKDYNHPSVIMYSSGNEVSETAQEKGIALTKEFTDYFHSLDGSRPVSCGINIFFNALSSLGFGVYSDKKAEKNTQAKAKKQEVGSAFFNAIANFAGSNVMKVGAMLPICNRKTRGAFANMDIAGYNYGIFRYKGDLNRYPDRLILGSETFCSDTRRWLKLAENDPRIVGDFVWSGMDYLGECGIGSWVNEDDAPSFDHGPGWISAGSGRIDITGKILGEGVYTQVMYGVKRIGLAIIAPKEHVCKHSRSAWKYSMAMPYYDFPGQEGGKVTAEVYSCDEKVALYLNDKLIGRKKVHKRGNTKFSFAYAPGELRAVGYQDGREVAATSLSSGKEGNHLTIFQENDISPNDKLLFIRLRLGDADGVIRPYLKSRIKIKEVTGGTLLGLGSGCPYYPDSYLSDEGQTYEGEMLAIFRVDEPESFAFVAQSDFGDVSFSIAQS